MNFSSDLANGLESKKRELGRRGSVEDGGWGAMVKPVRRTRNNLSNQLWPALEGLFILPF